MGLFSKPTETQVLEKVYAKDIANLHNEFNRAAEILYQDAVGILTKIGTIDKSKTTRLQAFGFTNVPEVEENKKKEKQLKHSEGLIELLNEYRQKYPLNRFITEDQVKIICNKYGLVYGSVSNFKGFVPDKNLKEMEDFFERYSFELAYQFVSSHHNVNTIITPGEMKYGSNGYDSVDRKTSMTSSSGGRGSTYINGEYMSGSFSLLGLNIAAPAKDFDLSEREIKNFKVVDKPIKDPVILQPVRGGFIIVTAWGDEASDPLVVHPLTN